MSCFPHLAKLDNDLLLVQPGVGKKLLINCLFPQSRMLQCLKNPRGSLRRSCRDCSTGQNLFSRSLFPQDASTLMVRMQELIFAPARLPNFLATLKILHWNQMCVEKRTLSLICFKMSSHTVHRDEK